MKVGGFEMKRLLMIVTSALLLAIIITTVIWASSNSDSGKKVNQYVISETNKEQVQIKEQKGKLKELRKNGIKTKEDNIKEDQLMEEIAKKEIANGTYDYDYKQDLEYSVNTLEAVVADNKRVIDDGCLNGNDLERAIEANKIWDKMAKKYRKKLEADYKQDKYKKICEEYYEEDRSNTEYLDEKYSGK